MEPFVVKFYTSEEGPIIKGNGFDGTKVGEDREEAEAFILWVNALIIDAERYRFVRTAGAFDSETGMDILSEHPERYDAAVDELRGVQIGDGSARETEVKG